MDFNTFDRSRVGGMVATRDQHTFFVGHLQFEL